MVSKWRFFELGLLLVAQEGPPTCDRRRDVFLAQENMLLGTQEDMSACDTRGHVLTNETLDET